MKTISLTNSDELVLVDDEDYDYLVQFNWQLLITKTGNSIYRHTSINSINYTIYLSRVVAERMNLDLTNQIDHIDRDIFNNCRNNLRAATGSQNTANRGLNKNNTSGYKGVCFVNEKQKYKARIKINRKTIHLGYFDDPIEAANTYDYYAKRFFGEFASLNFPD